MLIVGGPPRSSRRKLVVAVGAVVGAVVVAATVPVAAVTAVAVAAVAAVVVAAVAAVASAVVAAVASAYGAPTTSTAVPGAFSRLTSAACSGIPAFAALSGAVAHWQWRPVRPGTAVIGGAIWRPDPRRGLAGRGARRGEGLHSW